MEGGSPNQGRSNSRDECGADARPKTAFMPANHLSARKLEMQNTGGDHIDLSSTTINLTVYNEPTPDSGHRAQSMGLRINTSTGTHPANSKAESDTPPEISLLDVFAIFSSLISWIFKKPQLQESSQSHSDTGTPEVPVRAVEMKDLPLSLKPSLRTPTLAEIYVCDLMCSGYGLPCWDPRPRQKELRPAGVVPGDVGTYSVDDGFKKLFNLWDVEHIIRGIATTYCEGMYERLGGTSKTEPELRAGTTIAPGANCRSPMPPLEGQGGIVHQFSFSSSAGGILAVLSAANIEMTDDKEAMRTYIVQYAEAIYTHARRTGRTKPGESLYFVTGSIKNDLWARAVYQESRAHHDRLLELSRLPGLFSQNSPSSAYHWTKHPVATYRHHDDSGIEGLKNQTLFLQGFKLAFSPQIVARMEEVIAVSGSKCPGQANQSSQGRTDNPSQQGGGAPNPGGGGERNRQDGPSTSPPERRTQSTGSGEDSSGKAPEGAKNVKDMIEISQLGLSSRNVYHPCDIINKMLLDQNAADFALSHDDDWRDAFCDYSTETAAIMSADPSSTDILRDDHPVRGPRLSIVIQNGVACLERERDTHINDQKPQTSPHREFPPSENQAHGIHQTKDRIFDILDELRLDTDGLLKVIPQSEIQLATTSSGYSENALCPPVATGAHADIYKATMLSGDIKNRAVVVKVFRQLDLQPEEKKRDYYNRRIRREYGVWSILDHPNILHLEGLALLEALPSLGLVSEYKQHGDLLDFLKKNIKFDRLHMGRGVCSGLEYLHSQNVVHGNLTARKILVDLNPVTGQFFPLITASGSSRVLESQGYTTPISDTHEREKPPELWEDSWESGVVTNKQVFTPASDVYSFSLILLLLVTGKAPYTQEELPVFVLIAHIVDPIRPLRPDPEKYPVLDPSYNFCWPIMQACWKAKKEDRITSGEAHLLLSTGFAPPGRLL